MVNTRLTGNNNVMIRHSGMFKLVAVCFLLLIVCLGPRPFGSGLVRERTLLDACAFLALAFALGAGGPLPPRRGMALAALGVAAVGGLGLLQALPWPRAVAEFLVPVAAADGQAAAELLGVEAASFSLSTAPGVSRAVALHWLAVAAAMTAACLVGRERRHRRLLLGAFLAVAVFQVIYGADTWFDHQNRIWNVEAGYGSERLRGTFVNSNHTAMYLSFATVTTFASLWWAVRRARFQGSVEQRLTLVVAPALTFLLLFVGLAFTGSRGGLVAAVLALLCQAVLLTLPRQRLAGGVLAFLGILVGLGGVAWFSWERGFGRLLSTSAFEVAWSSRWTVWAESWGLFRSAPLTGTGLGTFRQAFPTVQPPDLVGSWTHAHNDVLELLLTVGLLGTLPMLLAFGAACRSLWKVLLRGRRSEDRALALAGAGALAAALLHSLVDFGLTIPANAFLLAILLGLVGGISLRAEEN